MEFDGKENLLIEKVDFTVEQLQKNKISLMTDLDGTRVRSAVLAVEKFNKQNNTKYTERDLSANWAMVKWAEALGYDNPRGYAIELWNSDEVMANSQPVQGAVELARFLYTHRKAKIEIPAVTARPASTRAATHAWHGNWMPWTDISRHLYMQDATDAEVTVSTEFKTSVLHSQEPTYYLEDQVQDAEAIIKSVPNTKVILVSQPWNESYEIPDEFKGRIIKPVSEPGQSKALMAFYALVEDLCT